MDKFYVISDGSNVAHHKKTSTKKARFKNLELLYKLLKKLKKKYSIKWEIVVDASLRHNIDKQGKLEHLINTGRIIQCPSKAEADDFILEFFKNHPENTLIISNDNFEDREIPNLNLFKFSIILDELIIFPNIEAFLESKSKVIEEVDKKCSISDRG